MANLEDNLRHRQWLLERLRAEIVGPDPSGGAEEIFSLEEPPLLTWEQFRRPRKQPDGEEILTQDRPTKRYGAGILFPVGTSTAAGEPGEEDRDLPIEGPLDPDPQGPTVEEGGKPPEMEDSAAFAVDREDEEDINLANAWNPSALGLSFLANIGAIAEGVTIHVHFATYEDREVRIHNESKPEEPYSRSVWLRRPGRTEDGSQPSVDIGVEELRSRVTRRWIPGMEDRLELVLVSRPAPGFAGDHRLVTVSMVNRQSRLAGPIDRSCFFQCSFRVEARNARDWIGAYPDRPRGAVDASEEENILELLYRDRRSFAIGHGCAAGWPSGRPDAVRAIWTESLPSFEIVPITADIVDSSGAQLRVSMRKLAGLDSRDDGRVELNRLFESYGEWIKNLQQRTTRPPVPTHLEGAADELTSRCRTCLERLKDGLEYLDSDEPGAPDARRAFRLANHAMLLSQLRFDRAVREPVIDDGVPRFPQPVPSVDPAQPHQERGYWRPFQIAFILMNLRSICQAHAPCRRTVELIWFPTGGGKTEAYLGLTAFTILFNRLTGSSGATDVLMRYTLRLLTTQQFQRAALLFCALEHLRRNLPLELNLGDAPFRMGMWVGGTATPNSRQEARTALRKLERDPRAENPFVLLKCPWCNARLGPVETERSARHSRGRSEGLVLGYDWVRSGGRATVVIRCSDADCEYGFDPRQPGKSPIPVVIIDEDVFEQAPNLVIGTVDKFAMLTWKPEARALFGLDAMGNRTSCPPSLIIQDELHLISGPLGSMVGAFESLVEELSIDRRREPPVVPKIIASTATISRAESQILAVYARDRTFLFPPSGLEAEDSFFAQEARDGEGQPRPGKLYAGVFAPGHGSNQTTLARAFASLLQYPAVMEVGSEDERDPWWTLLAFFNSLRELGNASTLLVADARDYLRVLVDRHGFSYGSIRQLLNWQELTSRIRSDQVPAVLQALERGYPPSEGTGLSEAPLDVCLASNIIEVGVDIDRLSLMLIAGQPKTTSQYIQVSGRVGRKGNAPGLVVVVYNPGKPRDRSHFEHFRCYHQSLYRQVEPTSVTPFSPPVVDRTLHSLIVAAVRQLSSTEDARSPRPFPLPAHDELRDRFERLMLERVRLVDPLEEGYLEARLQRRLAEWEAWDPVSYGGFGVPPEDPPLMHPAGSTALPGWEGRSWPTLTSLRNVDATCEGEVTGYYNMPADEDEA